MRLIPLPWAILGVTLLIGLSGAFGYRQGAKHKADQIAAQTLREEAARAEALEAAAQAIAKIKVHHVTIRERTEKEIERVPAECVAPDSLHDITNEAITGRSAGPGSVPATDSDAG